MLHAGMASRTTVMYIARWKMCGIRYQTYIYQSYQNVMTRGHGIVHLRQRVALRIFLLPYHRF